MNFEFLPFLALADIPSVTLLGCVTAYIFSEQKGLKSSSRFLKSFFPERSEAFYFRTDFIISALVGTCIGIILYSPITEYQALAAGVGWTAAFNIVKAEKTPRWGWKMKDGTNFLNVLVFLTAGIPAVWLSIKLLLCTPDESSKIIRCKETLVCLLALCTIQVIIVILRVPLILKLVLPAFWIITASLRFLGPVIKAARI
jgi:hypothetical protein